MLRIAGGKKPPDRQVCVRVAVWRCVGGGGSGGGSVIRTTWRDKEARGGSRREWSIILPISFLFCRFWFGVTVTVTVTVVAQAADLTAESMQGKSNEMTRP